MKRQQGTSEPRTCHHPRRTARRVAALARQAIRDARSEHEQLNLIVERVGGAKAAHSREYMRLSGQGAE